MNNNTVQRIFCSQCGTPNDFNANFCTSCGSKLIKPKAAVQEKPAAEPVIAPVVIPEPETPAVEEPAEEESAEETVVAPVVIPEPETPAVEEPIEEESAEETVVAPVVIPEPETPAVEEPAEEESAEETVFEEKPKVEEPVKEEKQEEVVPPVVVVPVTPKVSKKEAKLEKKLEDAKKKAQEEARKQAEKAEKKAEKAEKKAEKKAPKAEKKSNKAEKKSSAEAADTQSSANNYHIANNIENTSDQAADKPKKKQRQNFFLKILSFLLAIVLTAALIIAVPITLLNIFLTDQNIELIVDRAIVSIELEKLEFSTADGSQNLSGVLLDITDEFEGWDHITEDQINDALLEDFVKQFVTDTLKQYGMSLQEGKQMLGWTPEQIYDFIEANKDTIEELAREAGYEGNLPIKEKKDMMIANIEEKLGKDGISVNTLLGKSSEAEKIMDYLNAASILFSDETLYLAWGLVAFIVILLIFVNIGYFGSFLRACGFPAFIIGCIYFLAALAFKPVLSLVKIPNTALASVADFTVGLLAAYLMDITVIVAAVGLGMILVSLIADAIKRKIQKS